MVGTLAEHLGYIADDKRLDCFRRAFASTIRSGDTVADLGCGFGVLGLLCLDAGAAHVWGIDSSDAIEIARETVARAGLADRYTCIRERSQGASLPVPVDVVVCDHVGYFGLDYGIVEMLADARRRLLKPGGKMVPRRIDLKLAGVTSAESRAQAEAWSDPRIPAEYHWLRRYGVNTKYGLDLHKQDIATNETSLDMIDLSQDIPDLLAFDGSLAIERDGTLDGLAGWFDCELAEGVWMTNSPLSDQAIDRSQAFLPFDRPIDVVAGDRIGVTLSLRHDTGLMSWSVQDPRSGRRQKQSTWNSRILGAADLAPDDGKPPALNRKATARQLVYGYVDGQRTPDEIEAMVLRDHPDLFPSPGEIKRFVRRELARSTR